MRHQLTIRVTFDDTVDDADARDKAWHWMISKFEDVVCLDRDEVTLKLQRLQEFGPPKPVQLGPIHGS